MNPDYEDWALRHHVTSKADAWSKLDRNDWMLDLVDSAGLALDPFLLRRFACECAEGVLPLFEKHHPQDPRPRQALESAKAFAAGEGSRIQLDRAREAATLAWEPMARAWPAARAAATAAHASSLFAARHASQDAARAMADEAWEDAWSLATTQWDASEALRVQESDSAKAAAKAAWEAAWITSARARSAWDQAWNQSDIGWNDAQRKSAQDAWSQAWNASSEAKDAWESAWDAKDLAVDAERLAAKAIAREVWAAGRDLARGQADAASNAAWHAARIWQAGRLRVYFPSPF